MAFQAPTGAMAWAPPPEKTAATRTAAPLNAERGTRKAEQWREVQAARPSTSVPRSAFPLPRSLTGSSVVSPVHDPARAPFRRSLEAPLLVRRLGHDRRDRGGPAVGVERDVGHGARVGMPPLAREHVLPDDLDAHFHRRAAGGVDPRLRREQLAPLDRLPEVPLVPGHPYARPAGIAG